MGEQPVYLMTSTLRVSQQLLDDSIDWGDIHNAPSTAGPPAPPAHESHLFSNEGLEGCLLCGEWDDDRLAEICPFEVVPRRRPTGEQSE